MPSLSKPDSDASVALGPFADAALAAETDVLVVGGGPAGIGAALGAADAGARVVLAERYGFLGGMATAALVMPLASYHAAELVACKAGDPRLCPSDVGSGKPVIRGALERLVTRLVDAHGAIAPSPTTGFVVPFDAEVFKWVAQDLLDEAGVETLFHALSVRAIVGETGVGGAVFATKSGLLAVKAAVTIDCTGDADIAASAGAAFEIGRAQDGLTQPMTLMFFMGGFDRAAFAAYVKENPDQWYGVFGLWDLVVRAAQAGDYRLPREDVLLFATSREGEVTVNSTRVAAVLGTNAWDLSSAEYTARRQMRDLAEFLKRDVPGFEHAYVAQSGAQIGVRESRRVLGGHVLTAEEVLAAQKFDDVIARNAYPVDIHDPQGEGTTIRHLPGADDYDIPLRCLVPRGVDGLLVAGRCISATHEALSSVRVMPACVATGQAAGVCAALAARSSSRPRDVDRSEVQAELRRQGADLHGQG